MTKKEKTDVINAIRKIKESALFYLKLDLALIAGLMTIIQVLGIKSTEIFSITIQFKHLLIALGIFVTIELAIELMATREDAFGLLSAKYVEDSAFSIIFILYLTIGFGHIFVIGALIGALYQMN